MIYDRRLNQQMVCGYEISAFERVCLSSGIMGEYRHIHHILLFYEQFDMRIESFIYLSYFVDDPSVIL